MPYYFFTWLKVGMLVFFTSTSKERSGLRDMDNYVCVCFILVLCGASVFAGGNHGTCLRLSATIY